MVSKGDDKYEHFCVRNYTSREKERVRANCFEQGLKLDTVYILQYFTFILEAHSCFPEKVNIGTLKIVKDGKAEFLAVSVF